jgi:hypothetical protein
MSGVRACICVWVWQRLSDTSEAKATPEPPRSPCRGAAGVGGGGAMVGVEHRVRVEIQALNIVEPRTKKQKLWNHWPKALGESKSKSSRKSSSTSMAKLPQAAAAVGDEHQMEDDARKEASEEEIEGGDAGAAVGGKEAVAGVKDGELPTPADLVASAEFEFNGCNPFKRKRPSDAASGSHKGSAGGGDGAADASSAAAAVAAELAHAAGVVGKAAGKAAGKAMGKAGREAGKATGKLLTAAAGLFKAPHDASKAPPPPPLQCKVFLAKAGGQRVGESQFLAPHANVNTAEFVREDDGEACVHFEMHDGAETPAGGGAGGGGVGGAGGGGAGGGGHKAVYSTQLPLAALDGRTTLTVFREGKACGSMQLAVTEEERVVRKRGSGGANADTQDADQLLGIYDLVVRVALQEEGVGPRRLRLLGPWQALLSQFSAKFNVRSAYCELRLLVHIMDAATPTADCLGVLLEKLPPLLQQRQQGQLVRCPLPPSSWI